MNPITDIWRQLVRRRLWPVALLLVAALAAVPMLLAKDPEPSVAPAPAPASTGTAKASLASEPIVAAAGPADPNLDRKPLGDRHDIFKPTKKAPKVKATKDDDAKGTSTDESKDTTTEPGSKGSTGSDGGTTTPTPVEPAPEPKTFPLYSLKVRFTVAEVATKRHLPRLTALPSREEPLLVYMGLLDDHKTAVFLLDSTLRAVGDGKCHPTPENCETVRMRVGDTMFFDVVGENGAPSGAQFQLDLLHIKTEQTDDAAKAAKSARLAKTAAISSLRSGAAGLGGDSLRQLGVVGRTG